MHLHTCTRTCTRARALKHVHMCNICSLFLESCFSQSPHYSPRRYRSRSTRRHVKVEIADGIPSYISILFWSYSYILCCVFTIVAIILTRFDIANVSHCGIINLPYYVYICFYLYSFLPYVLKYAIWLFRIVFPYSRNRQDAFRNNFPMFETQCYVLVVCWSGEYCLHIIFQHFLF